VGVESWARTTLSTFTIVAVFTNVTFWTLRTFRARAAFWTLLIAFWLW
jgi:hypothetical protein